MTDSTMHRPRTKQEWFFYDNSVKLLGSLIRGAYLYSLTALLFFIAAVADKPNSVAIFWGIVAVVWLCVAQYHHATKQEIERAIINERI